VNGNAERLKIVGDLGIELDVISGIEAGLAGLECEDEVAQAGVQRLLMVHHERLEQIIARLEPLLGVNQRGPEGGPPGGNVVDIGA
jgi:hypothetical protein